MKSALMIAFLTLLYGLCILPARLVAMLLGRDSLQLRRDRAKNSYWLPKAPVTDVQNYFSQNSDARATPSQTPRLTCRYGIGIFRGLARWFAPKREAQVETASSSQRQQGIPDEIYTLW